MVTDPNSPVVDIIVALRMKELEAKRKEIEFDELAVVSERGPDRERLSELSRAYGSQWHETEAKILAMEPATLAGLAIQMEILRERIAEHDVQGNTYKGDLATATRVADCLAQMTNIPNLRWEV